MFNDLELRLETLNDGAARLGISRPLAYTQMAEHLLPPTICLGKRGQGFLAHEIDAIIAARAVGTNDNELKNLVMRLVDGRKELLDNKWASEPANE